MTRCTAHLAGRIAKSRSSTVPLAHIVASVLLQAGGLGYISGQLDATGSIALSCLGFGSATVIFNVALLLRRIRRSKSAAPRPKATRLLVLMNVVTAITFLSFYAALTWIPSALATGIETAIGPAVLSFPRAGWVWTSRRRSELGCICCAGTSQSIRT